MIYVQFAYKQAAHSGVKLASSQDADFCLPDLMHQQTDSVRKVYESELESVY